VTKCGDLAIVGGRGKGRPRKSWNHCVEEDMRALGLKSEDALERGVWRKGIHGVPIDPRKRRNTDVKR
jgi:hypothetical protein